MLLHLFYFVVWTLFYFDLDLKLYLKRFWKINK
jgi:hypothetical protein